MNLLYSLINIITTPIRAIYALVAEYAPGLNFLTRLSLAFKWALLSLLFLVILWVAALLKHVYFTQDKTDYWWSKAILATPLILIIPCFVYYFVKYLMMVETSRYPELDQIWDEAVNESRNKGISISNTPLFLVLGVSRLREVNTIVQMTELSFSVHVPTAGDPPIAIHACNEGFFVFLNQCSCISKLSTGSTAQTAPNAASTESGMQPTDVGGTIDVNQLGAMSQAIGTAFQGLEAPNSPVQPGGTMLLDESMDLAEIFKPANISKQLSSQDSVECLDRLKHVCGLIKKARLPLCPINGIVSALPFELVENSSGQLQIAIQKDLAVLREEFQVRCPNTVLVTGMELEDGFVELINRLPPQKVKENRFGKGCDLWVAPDAARLDAIAIHATSTFEDWIYMLFQEENALLKKYNSRLFMMLCRVRGTFANNLRSVLARGFGFDPKIEAHLAFEQFLFGGCYFAATGNSPSHQAFVKSVFAKALQQEGELEWSPAARREDNFYQFMANLAALFGTIALLVIAGMLAYHFGYLSKPKI